MKTDLKKIHKAISPECIAIVGRTEGWTRFLREYKGQIISVQIDPERIKVAESMGLKNYLSVRDIPGHVDLVIVATPREVAPQILEDCIAKGVGCVHFFTAGFGETGTEKGKEIEQHITSRAHEAGCHVIGPNCMGVFNPGIGLRYSERQFPSFIGREDAIANKAGAVSVISQSGVQLETISIEGPLQGVDIGKSVSFGNGIVLESSDFLEYLGQDDEAKVIAMYLEGVRDGKRFFEVLREVAARKPVVIWKGGRTEEGGRATTSHSGSLAIPRTVWESLVKQCGAISVTSLEELMDTCKAFLYLPRVTGDRVGLVAGSGGRAVTITDSFVEAGLKVPVLTKKTYDELGSFFRMVGGSMRNPIDLGSNQMEHMRIMRILEKDDNVDNLVLLTWAGWELRNQPDMFMKHIPELSDIRSKTSKPLMVILSHINSANGFQRASEMAQHLRDAGIPSFPSAERGARALKRAYDFYSRQKALAAKKNS